MPRMDSNRSPSTPTPDISPHTLLVKIFGAKIFGGNIFGGEIFGGNIPNFDGNFGENCQNFGGTALFRWNDFKLKN